MAMTRRDMQTQLEDVRHELQCKWLTARREGRRADMDRLGAAIKGIETAQQALTTA